MDPTLIDATLALLEPSDLPAALRLLALLEEAARITGARGGVEEADRGVGRFQAFLDAPWPGTMDR